MKNRSGGCGRLLCGCWCAGVLSLAAAEPLVVDTGTTGSFTNGTDVVFDAPIRVSDRAIIEKTGAGMLTLKSGAFTENKDVAIHVREGAVAIARTPSVQTAYEQPAAVMEKAALWFDASQKLVLKDADANEVVQWLDVRETGDGSEANPFRRVRAVAFTNNWLTACPLVQVFQEKTGIYFRGYGSGCFMNWVTPADGQATVGNVRNVFMVIGGTTCQGDHLGQRNGSMPYFQRGGSTDIVWMRHNSENKAIHAARTFVDGVEIDPFYDSPYGARAIHLTAVESLGGSLSAQCFFNDRDMQLKGTDGTNVCNTAGTQINAILGNTWQMGGGNRAGGEYIFEVLLFTNQLTAAERMDVQNWLLAKWKGVTPPAAMPATEIVLASNAVFAVSETPPTNVTIVGDGVLRKEGEGTAIVRSAYAPRQGRMRVQVDEGRLVMDAGGPFVCSAGDTITSTLQYWGPELAAPVAGADVKSLVKNGTGPVRLDAIPEGVRRIAVNGGSLALASPERRIDRLRGPDRNVCAVIPEWDFESYPASSHTGAFSANILDGGESQGWHAIVPDLLDGKTQDSKVFFFDQAKGSPYQWNMSMGTPNGTGVLVIKNNASAWCEVEVPEAGEYVLSFWAAPRLNCRGPHLDVRIGRTLDTSHSYGVFNPATGDWRQYAFLPVRLDAGTQQLWFANVTNNLDYCTQFDAIRLTRVEDEVGAYAIPNGGFEVHGAGFKNTFTLDNTNQVPGFTVRQHDWFGADPERNGGTSNTTFSVAGGDWGRFNLPWNTADSLTQFFMTGRGSALSTTFTPPAGVWRFQADYCNFQIAAGENSGYIVTADVSVGGGDSQSLGAVTNRSHKLLPHVWPGAFTVDGMTPVTLTLVGDIYSKGSGHAILDNLKLVSVYDAENLLEDGGFEREDAWTLSITRKPFVEANGGFIAGAQYLDYGGGLYKTYFGSEAFQGSRCVSLVNDDAIHQSVFFPTGGLYRFSANFASRSAPNSLSFSAGLNPVAFYFAKDGVTNWLGCTDTAMTTNFHEYAFIGRIPDAGGTYDVGFRGRTVYDGVNHVDRTMLIDAAQLYRIETETDLAFSEDLEIALAADARLTLDFDGTNEISRLSIGSRSLVGVISLAERPELLGTLSGRGAFFIRPKGTVFIFR